MASFHVMNNSESEILQKADQIHDYVTNTSETVVLKAKYVAFYKGVLVIKIPWMESSGLSMGVIFLGSDVTSPSTVRHEYGHTVQMAELGFVNYLVWVGIPSLHFYRETEKGRYSWDQYYDRPWELIADYYGQVDRQYSPEYLNTAAFYWFWAKYYSSMN